MARKIREEVAGGIYHVFARGNNREEIFVNGADRLLYLRLLGTVTLAANWNCLGYCLMPNHIHLLLETPNGNLSEGMQRLQGRYTQAFNARHDRSGHVFQGRYGAVRIESDRQLATVVQYIDTNPVEAGLCIRGEEWPWSSAHDLYEGVRPDWLDERRLQALLGTAVADSARLLTGSDPVNN